MDKPYFFVCPTWGESYVQLLCNVCIASLLAEGNIPALRNKKDSRFIIPSTPEDWEKISDHPTIRLLNQHIETVFVDLTQFGPVHSNDDQKYNAASAGYKAGAELAYEANSYAMFLAPDMMVSDNAIRFLESKADEGKSLILSSALRFNQEQLVSALDNNGYLKTGKPLSIDARDLMRLSLPHLHAESLRYEWDSPFYSDFSFCALWFTKDKKAMTLHSHNWAIMLLDFGAIDKHDTNDLDEMTIDGGYAYDNFGASGDHIYIISDSDELAYVSFTPDNEMNAPLKINAQREEMLAGMHHGPRLNPLHREAFKIPITLHSYDLNDEMRSQAKTTAKIIENALQVEGTETIWGRRRRRYVNDVHCRWKIVRDLFSSNPIYVTRDQRATLGFASTLASLIYYSLGFNYFGKALNLMKGFIRSFARRLRDFLLRGYMEAKEKSKIGKLEDKIKHLEAGLKNQEILEQMSFSTDPFYIQYEPNLFLADTEQKETFEKLSKIYWNDRVRVIMLMNIIRVVNQLDDGDFVELGTYQGDFARMLYMLMPPDQDLFLFDTFGGFDKRDTAVESKRYGNEIEGIGGFDPLSPEAVRLRVGDGTEPDNVRCIPGWFPQSYDDSFDEKDRKWRFVHLDFDLYAPTIEALRRLWPNVVPGGAVLMHDYGCPGYPGVKEAVDEFFSDKEVSPVMLADTFGSALVFKPHLKPSVDKTK